MIPKICALGVLLAVVAFLLSEMGFKGKRVFALLSAVIVLTGLISELGGIFTGIEDIFGEESATGLARSALKIVGIGYVFGISCEVAEELEQTGIAKTLALFGRVEIVGLTLPYVKEMIELGISLIK